MRLWARKRVHYWLVQEKLGVGQRRDLCWIGQMKRILQQRIERCIIFTKRIWNMKSYFEHVSVLCFACTTKKDSNWILLWYTGILELDNEEKIVNRWNYFRPIPSLGSYIWQGKHYQVASQWTNESLTESLVEDLAPFCFLFLNRLDTSKGGKPVWTPK